MEEDAERDGHCKYGWRLLVGEYLSYDCDCTKASTMAILDVDDSFHEALRAGIKMLDEWVGENTPFELLITKELSVECK